MTLLIFYRFLTEFYIFLIIKIRKIYNTDFSQVFILFSSFLRLKNMNDNSSFATCFLLFPVIIASLSVVAYQQAQATTTNKNCNNFGRWHSGASSCQQVCNTTFSTKGSTRWNTQKSDPSPKTAEF